MEKSQADAAAEAVLSPEVRKQEEVRKQRASKAAHLARKHRVAWFVLAGCAIGTGAAYSSGTSFLLGFHLGGLAGLAAGWLIARQIADQSEVGTLRGWLSDN